ncbi:MAG TPA: hypothetical protein VMH79_09370, partial [Thermoanaerobaculia bacterium]|nr:hypothetical protein [Thermoanaerobaculia bacterium]
RNVQDYFGTPVLSATFDGNPVTLPMSGLSVATPVGWNAPDPTGPEFNAFLVRTTRFARQAPDTAGSPRPPTRLSPRPTRR